MWQRYYTVQTKQEALELLGQYAERARLIAGGTDILIELERNQRPETEILIDVSRIPGLDTIQMQDGQFHLGPLVTHNMVVDSDLLIQHALPLAQACWEVGSPQIRNRATIVGNLITGSPANDTITPLIALNASVTLASTAGERTVPLKDFYNGVRQTVMRPDEMMTGITFSAMTKDDYGAFIKLGLREAQAISVINVAAILRFDGDLVRDAAIALGSVAPTIIRTPEAEKALLGHPLDEAQVKHAARLAADVTSPIDDIRSTAGYRKEMVKVITARALRKIAGGDQEPTWFRPAAMLWGKQNGYSDVQSRHFDGTQAIHTTVNGQSYTVKGGYDRTLLDFLREDIGLPGTKEGCAEGECGACTVHLDGAAVMACMVPAPRADGAEIITIEGLAIDDELHPIQQAFINESAVQCGYCTPGFLMSGAKLLEEHEVLHDEQIRQSISGNLCRCTGYYKIVEAFRQAKGHDLERTTED